MLKCHIVLDLLPNYIDHLTSPETEREIEEHLSACESCRKAKDSMTAEVNLAKAPKPQLNFLKRFKRKQLIAATFSLLVAIMCLGWFYGQEYYVDLKDTSSLKQLIQSEISFDARYSDTEIQFVDSISEKNQVMILYRLDDKDGYRGKGVAAFRRGLFGKYRIYSIGATTWALDSYSPVRIGLKDYLLLGNVNQPVGAETMRIYANYHFPYHEGDPIDTLLSTTQPIYEGEAETQRFSLIPITKEQAEQNYWGYCTVYYDADGEIVDSVDIARQYYGMENNISGDLVGHTHSLQALAFWMFLVSVLGVIFIRYFLTI